MSDHENNTENQEHQEDPSTNQANNGFEVLTNENNSGTDRKDENEGEQQNLPETENPTEQQATEPENKEEATNQEPVSTEETKQESIPHNEDQPQSEQKDQTESHHESQPEHDNSPKKDSPVHHSQPEGENEQQTHQEQPQHEEKHEEAPQQHEEPVQQETEAPKDQSPQEKVESQPTKQESESPKQPIKEKWPIYVPNYTTDQPEEEEKKSPQQKTGQFPQQGGQQFNPFYQQFVAQQFAARQQALALQQQQQQQAGGQQFEGQQDGNQVANFNPGQFNPAQFNPAQFNPAQFNPGQFNPAQFNPQFFQQFQQGQMGQLPFMQPQQPVFLPIVDVCAEYQKGNFLPGIHCLYYNLVPKDYIDATGYNILHHAISYNNIEVVIALLDHLGLDIHLRSKTNQSCVMIASNFGFNEMLKVVLDRGGRLDEQDDTRFTALLYCIKQGHLSTFLYLLSRGANYKIPDVNGCTVVHWAAYKNNVFLLRLFRRMGLDMNGVDLAGFSPLQRAISSEAVQAVKYLVEDVKVPVTTALQPDTITNLGIKKIILDQLPTPKGFIETQKKALWTVFEQSSQTYTFAFYLINIVLAFLGYASGIVAVNELTYVYHIIFFVFALYFAAYTYWYFLKSSESITKLKTFAYQRLGVSSHGSTIIDSSQEMTVRSPYKQDYIDNLIAKGGYSLLDRKEDSSYPYPSFLHELYFLFEKGDWERVAMWEEKKYCPTTLLLKKPKNKFCKETNTVVEGFNHYSHTLKRPIDKNIHPFYLLLLVQQTTLLFLYVLAAVLTFWNDRTGSILMVIPETVYLQTTKTGTFLGLYLFVTLIYLGYSAFFTLIEIYCLMKNLTYNEFFNSHRYPYLYRPNPFAQGGQQLVKIYYNPNDHGIWNNICDYFSRIMH